MRAREAQLLHERYLVEGGASGHLMHLYDNRDLTFGELKEVLAAAAEGKLERVTEKLDGMNLVFTHADDGLKVARSGGDIKDGGMDAAALAAKFAGRGNVEEAFNGAFKVLHDALAALPDRAKQQAFRGGKVWYSIEVIYSKNPNVINYDRNWIVFHDSPVFWVTGAGSIEKRSGGAGAALLSKHVEQMQKAVTQHSWQVRGPAVLRLKQLSDGSALRKATNAIEAAQSAGRVGDSDTINTYLHNVVAEEVADLGLGVAAARAVTARVVGSPGAPTLPDIKKLLAPEQHAGVSAFVKASPALLKRAIEPIEKAVHAFSVEVLRGMQSALVGNSDAEVQRLRQQVSQAASAIEASGSAQSMDVLQKQMQKLGSLENVSAAMEGIVFVYKGHSYKFTGSFAPANQILGLFRYGRGEKVSAQETYLRMAVDRLVAGGRR